jgi:peptidoglycan/LPS O-acetylase OafA/YrhL
MRMTRRAYVPELDGFRALAVMLVVGYHMTAPIVVGGFIGVWIFFVLSGFLITSLLVAELDRRGSIDIKRFYVRRATRLYPALVLGVVVAVTVAAIAHKARGETIASVPYALTYLTNLEPWLGVSHHGFLDHTWSLAIEAQFYLAWPFLTIVLMRRGHLAAACLVLALGCVALLVLRRVVGDPSPISLLPSFHLFPLLMGAWLAAATFRREWPERATWAATWIGLAAIVAIALTARSSTDQWMNDWGFAVVSLGATGVIAGLSRGGVPVLSRLFRWDLAVWIGQRSYGIYLYHYAICLTLLNVHTIIRVPLVIALTFVLAELSWRFVESPLLRRGRGIRGHVEATEPSSLALARA